MKILNLRFKNLNSLYGEWTVDFTLSEYGANGIFAIVGPTGAGKSTILDAICLALYGQTPRLGKVTKSTNEIMSRQTGECFAEVTFESQQGIFRCHWSQHRARKSPAGKLADSRHEISDVRTGQILESKKRDVAGAIESRTGMDFERFTRSILLAQGGFDSFLRSESDNRAPILEQITGTDIYSRISVGVHERLREEKQSFELLQAQVSGISLLDPEQIKELTEQTEKVEHEGEKGSGELKKLDQSLLWLERIDNLKKELSTLCEKKIELDQNRETFKGDDERLERSLRAGELDGAYASLASVREQQKSDREACLKEERDLPLLKKELLEGEQNFHKIESSLKQTVEAINREKPLIREVQALDHGIEEINKNCVRLENELAGFHRRIGEYRTNRDSLSLRVEQLKKEKIDQQLLRESSMGDEVLLTLLGSVEEQIDQIQFLRGNLESLKKSCRDNETLLIKNKEVIRAQEGKLDLIRKEQSEKKKQIQEKKDELRSLLGERDLKEYRREKEGLLTQRIMLNRIADLESERERLEDGQPCPLCGAAEHPYAEGNIPEADSVDKGINRLTGLIEKAEEGERVIRNGENEEVRIVQTFTQEENRLKQLIQDNRNKESELQGNNRSWKEALGRLVLKEKELLGNLDFLEEDELPEDLSALLDSLRDRRDLWQKLKERGEILERQISEVDSEIKRFDSLMESHKDIIEEKDSLLKAEGEEKKKILSKRYDLYSDKNPLQEETRLNLLLEQQTGNEKTLRQILDGVRSRLEERTTIISRLKMGIEKRSGEMELQEETFKEALSRLKFVDENLYLACRLSPEERGRLSQQKEELRREQINLDSRFQDREENLKTEQKKNLTELSKEELIPLREKLSLSLKELGEERGALKQKLAENETLRSGLDEKYSQIEKHKTECLRWEKLHGLIGSADGKKYRNFAQGITFELMVAHANRQLTKMTDRYLLIRDSQVPLELNVVDNYQAGEIRSTKNLSGGEGFIVSLALALGLSQMASRKVRVDSLFLDEGFGTLDEEALEMALENLSGLQQEGKIIGVISHVPALKERIRTQLTIEPSSGGRSKITGPGVSRLPLQQDSSVG